MTSNPTGPLDSPYEFRPTDSPRDDQREAALVRAPAFGTVFTDHMARATWSASQGWTERRVEKYAPLSLDPASSVLHYGQEIFEGLKAYRHGDGSVWTFRPQANGERFAGSAQRLAMPQLPVGDFVEALQALVRADLSWVPAEPESSLYLRPFMYASEAFLGVRAAKQAEFVVIASPTGPYFAGGVAPVSIWVDRQYSRAGAGGTGAAKCGGNYASSLLPQIIASEHGCDQVCFLDAESRTYLEELGGMNIALVMADGSVHTPELSGSILEGITRTSLLQLVTDRGRDVIERRISLAEVTDGIADGSITEVFACGTAAVLTPVGRLVGEDFDLVVADGAPGELTMSLRAELTGIQTGQVGDRHGWLHRLA